MIACTQQRPRGFGVHVSGQSGAEGAGKNSGLRLLGEGSRDMQLAVAKVAYTVACRCHQTGASSSAGFWDLGTEICRDPNWSSRTGSGVSDLLLLSMLHGPGALVMTSQVALGDSMPLTLTFPFSSGLAPGYRGSSQSFNVSAEKFVSDGSIHVPASSETTRWRCHLHDSSHVCLASKQKWSAT